MIGVRFVIPGEKLPDVGLPDLEGRRRSLLDYTDKNLLIFVWASW